MPRVKSIIHIDFTTWDGIEDSVRSLINFYMKNASCFFRGDTTNNVLSSMSGNIRANLHSIMSVENDLSDFATPTGLEMDIVYSDSTFPSTAHNWLPDCITNIVTRNSLVKLCKMTSSTVETFSGGIDPIDSLSVTLTPKIGDTVITDTRYIPKNIKSGIVRTGVDTSHQDFESDYQLRTSSFYIDDGEGNIEQDVFYKIGICPLDNKYPYSNFSGTPTTGLTLDTIKALLEDDNLSLRLDNTYIQGYYYRLLNGNMAIKNSSTFGSGGYGFAKSFIIPIIDEDKYIVGLAYAELYKQNGDLFTEDVTNTDIEIYCRPSENEDPELVKLSGNGLQLILTDQHLDSGFIYTAYEKEDGDDITQPLRLMSKQDGSTVRITVGRNGNVRKFSVSTDGETWQVYSGTITLNNGESVYVKANQKITSTQDNPTFELSGVIEAYNNINSLLDSNFENITDLSTYKTYTLYNVFANCVSLTRPPALPATVLQSHCYDRMFYNCSSLTKAPKLPASVLAESCYYDMFNGCTSLINPPKLPATTLATGCYYQMFSGCTSLTQAPDLSATTLAQGCYTSMFWGCTSLTQSPSLPNTTLADSCYSYMFNGCTSLVNPPQLPATILTPSCYSGMFSGCTSLREAPQLPATTLANDCYKSMFYNCSSLTQAPELPATTALPDYCYSEMFYKCTSLTQAPQLPALSLGSRSYFSMFRECTSLTQAPNLPATTIGTYCYYDMFQDCTSLVQTPTISAVNISEACCLQMFLGCTSLTQSSNLPATTLANRCYEEMFKGCVALIKAPQLPATTLANNCYFWMFSGCSQLNEVHIYATDISAQYCLNQWLYGVSSTGDFYCVSGVNYSTGASGIPSGWTRHDLT